MEAAAFFYAGKQKESAISESGRKSRNESSRQRSAGAMIGGNFVGGKVEQAIANFFFSKFGF